MAADFDKQKFNDDLLLGQTDREVAARRYPTILHVLDNPELRNYFATFDAPANRAKRSSRTAGFIAIVLAGAALMVAAADGVNILTACRLVKSDVEGDRLVPCSVSSQSLFCC